MSVTTGPAGEAEYSCASRAQPPVTVYLQEMPSRIIWKNWPDEVNMRKFFTARLQNSLARPNARCMKAVQTQNDKQVIVGNICLTKQNGVANSAPTPTTTAASSMILPDAMNIDFIREAGAIMEEILGLMTKEHYYISAFAVAPDYQRSRLGTALLRHCLEIIDAEKMSCWLIAFPRSRNLYLRHGFEDRAHRDVDLNA